MIMKSGEKGRLSTMGPMALEQIAGLNIDLFFMGAGGVDTTQGWTNSNHVEAVIKRADISRSNPAGPRSLKVSLVNNKSYRFSSCKILNLDIK